MSIFVDFPIYVKNVGGRKKYAHMISSVSIEVLHAYALKMGIPRWCFHNSRGAPHYELNEVQLAHVKNNGAIQVSSREMLIIARNAR